MLSINISELIWGIINFFLLYFLLKHFLYTPVTRFMEARRAKIDDGLEKERQAQEAQKENELRIKNLHDSSRNEAKHILAEGRDRDAHNQASEIHAAHDRADAAKADFKENADVLRAQEEKNFNACREEFTELLIDRVLSREH